MKTKTIICKVVAVLLVYAGSVSAHNGTEGASNNFFGTGAGASTTTGNYNSFYGGSAGTNNTSGEKNTFIGYRAGYNNTEGAQNIFNGYQAGFSNTDGWNNTFIGMQAGFYNTEGYQNTFNGQRAGYENTTGVQNTFNGFQAGYENTTGGQNTFTGYQAGYNNTEGVWNSFYGQWAGYSNTTGRWNTYNGYRAGYNNIDGETNTMYGARAGHDSTGSGNVFLGYTAGYNESGSNMLYIDNSDTSEPLIYGEFDNDFVEINGDLYVTGNTYVDSDESLKKDINLIESSLEKIMGVNGVTYKWNKERQADGQKANRSHYGVIAQQVEEVLPEIVDKGDDGKRRVAYMELIPVLIEAVKEQQGHMQRQQRIITDLTHEVAELKRKMELRDRLASVME
jgi:hypothetical protein